MKLSEKQEKLIRESKIGIRVIKHKIKDYLEAAPDDKNTMDEYRKIYENILDHPSQNLIEYAVDHTLIKGTFYRYKSAFQHCLCLDIQDAIALFHDDPTKERLIHIRKMHKILKRYSPKFFDNSKQGEALKKNKLALKDKTSLYPEARIIEVRKKRGVKERTRNKRKSLNGLPEDWQILVADQMAPEYSSATLLMALLGCRPVELGNGVEFNVTVAGHLKCIIHGGKHKEDEQHGKGYKTRTITFDPEENLIANFLKHEVLYREKSIPNGNSVWVQLPGCVDKGNKDPEFRAAVKKFGNAIRQAAQVRCGFPKVSSLSFRHQLGSNIKGFLGEDRQKIALTMGHRSTRTQSRYGQAKYAQGGKGLGDVSTDKQELLRDSHWNLPEAQRPERRPSDGPSQ